MGSESGVGWEIVISYYCWWPRSYIKSWFFFLIVTDVIGFLGYFAKNVGIWDENDGKERFVKMWEKERSSFSSQCNSLIISLLQITALPKWLCWFLDQKVLVSTWRCLKGRCSAWLIKQGIIGPRAITEPSRFEDRWKGAFASQTTHCICCDLMLVYLFDMSTHYNDTHPTHKSPPIWSRGM